VRDQTTGIVKSDRIRLWPPAAIALIHVAAAVALRLFGSTNNIENGIALGGVPLISTLLFVLWWLALSRVPVWSRLAGFVLFGVAVTVIALSQRPLWFGALLVAIAVPYMTIGTVLVLLATYRMRWRTRRWLLVACLLGCTGVFGALRVESLGGDLAPILSWRWRPTEVERSEKEFALEGGGVAELPPVPGPDDWPDFRGAGRQAILNGVRFRIDKSAPPREIWRRPIGAGWSSFIAVGDYLFTQEQRGEEELVTCYQAATGEPVWNNSIQAVYDDSMGLGPRATPVYAEGRLYTQGCTGILQCLDATTGAGIWQRDLKKDAEMDVPTYGFCSSPLVAGHLLIVFTGGGEGECVIAYDGITGAEAWRGGELGGGYCSPMLDAVRGVPQVVMASNAGLEGFVAETGDRLWAYKWKSEKYPRSVQPFVYNQECVMLAATTGTGTRLVRVKEQDSEWTAEERWTCEKCRPYFNNGVFHEGHYYGYDGERLACLEVETGKRLWTGEPFSGQLLLIADMDMLLVLSEIGEVAFVPAVPGGFRVIARFQAIGGKTWNHPIIAHGRLFVRNAEEAACFELAVEG